MVDNIIFNLRTALAVALAVLGCLSIWFVGWFFVGLLTYLILW